MNKYFLGRNIVFIKPIFLWSLEPLNQF